MTEKFVSIPTGTFGDGDRCLGLRVWDHSQHPMVDVQLDTGGVCAKADLFLLGVEKAFNVTIAPKDAAEGTEDASLSETDLFVGYTINEYWQLRRAADASAVLIDNEGAVWSYEWDDDEEAWDWAPAVHDSVPQGSPDSLYITDCFPATVIYIRGY